MDFYSQRKRQIFWFEVTETAVYVCNFSVQAAPRKGGKILKQQSIFYFSNIRVAKKYDEWMDFTSESNEVKFLTCSPLLFNAPISETREKNAPVVKL